MSYFLVNLDLSSADPSPIDAEAGRVSTGAESRLSIMVLGGDPTNGDGGADVAVAAARVVAAAIGISIGIGDYEMDEHKEERSKLII
jgi:hypothetical protein